MTRATHRLRGRPAELTLAAVARLAGCNQMTVWRAVQAEELPAFRLGPRRPWRVKEPDARAWAEASRRRNRRSS